MTRSDKYFEGRYRGVVVGNVDAYQTGRLQVRVQDVVGADKDIWADSASPLAGNGMGLYMVPPKGSGVWVEFENGDPNSAVWTGCWRGSSSDVPSAATAAPPDTPPIVLATTGQHVLILSDESGPSGGLTLRSKGGASITITDDAITIANGKGASISLKNNTVDVNNGALSVT